MEKIKNCPFCGTNASITFNTKHMFVPRCMNAFCMLNKLEYGFKTEDEAIKGWNKRVNNSKIKNAS